MDQVEVLAHLREQRSAAGDVERLRDEVDEETLRAACSRIKRIDYKTVSIVFFEQTLLGIYEGAEREYRVVYPED